MVDALTGIYLYYRLCMFTKPKSVTFFGFAYFLFYELVISQGQFIRVYNFS